MTDSRSCCYVSKQPKQHLVSKYCSSKKGDEEGTKGYHLIPNAQLPCLTLLKFRDVPQGIGIPELVNLHSDAPIIRAYGDSK